MTWTNMDTLRAYGVLSAYKDLIDDACKDSSYDSLEALLMIGLDRGNFDIEYVLFSVVNFEELSQHFKTLKTLDAFETFINAG